jgi:hypothetical protein
MTRCDMRNAVEIDYNGDHPIHVIKVLKVKFITKRKVYLTKVLVMS